jgi:transposase
MKLIWDDVPVFLATAPIDMRKEINGLVTLVVESLAQSPNAESIYVFYNRQRDKIKCLWWDKNGFVLYYKRLEKSRFKFPKTMPESGINLNKDEFSWLLAGLDFYLIKEK